MVRRSMLEEELYVTVAFVVHGVRENARTRSTRNTRSRSQMETGM